MMLVSVQLPNFNSLAVISLIAAVMSVTYSTLGWTTALAVGRGNGESIWLAIISIIISIISIIIISIVYQKSTRHAFVYCSCGNMSQA